MSDSIARLTIADPHARALASAIVNLTESAFDEISRAEVPWDRDLLRAKWRHNVLDLCAKAMESQTKFNEELMRQLVDVLATVTRPPLFGVADPGRSDC